MNPCPLPPAGWLPIHLTDHCPPARLDWAFFGDTRLDDPFFEQTVGSLLRHPARLLFRRRTGLDLLEDFSARPPELAPTGFVFHLSRCGSTFVAQTLAADHRHLVLSEASPIDQLLAHDAADPSLTFERRIARLRGLVHAFARRRRPEETRLFIKFDAWHTLHLPVIRAAFPDTPWIFLHRDPVEVLVSQHRQRGGQFLPGRMDPRPFGIEPAELSGLDFDTYTARVLHASVMAALSTLEAGESGGLALDYTALRTRLTPILEEHFRLPPDEPLRAAIRSASERNAKNPAIPFEADSAPKQREASPHLRQLAARWLEEPHRRLLELGARPPARSASEM